MAKEDLTIVINTFKSDEKIYSCLNSISKEFNVLIIENSLDSKFKDTIEKKYSNVNCILTGENLGYANGNNLGLSKVTTKFALILNPDTVVGKNSLENFLITAKKNSDFALIGPAVQEKNNNQIEIPYNKDVSTIEVDVIKGFAMFLNMDQFKNIGFFDKNFFIYFEEIDLCRRVKKLKKKIYLDSSIEINHIGGSSHNKEINFEMELSRNWHWMWSTFYYHRKYNNFFVSFIKIFPKLFSAICKVVIYSIIFNKEKKKIYYQRLSGLLNSIVGKKSWYRPKVF